MRVTILFFLFVLCGCSRQGFKNYTQVTADIRQFKKAEFRIVLEEDFENPYDQQEIALNMILRSPAGDSLFLPCFFEKHEGNRSVWMARFTPRERGKYVYYFECITREGSVQSLPGEFVSAPSGEDGFLNIHDLWTLQFDSGKPFRGIGENVGWEPRSFSDPKWTYDYLLPKLSQNGVNFFRSWMAPNNFPLEWKTVKNTNRYEDTNEYFNPGGVRRLDEVVEMADSLNLYMMLAFDSHNTLIEGNQWEFHNYNKKNGGPAATPTEFFTLRASRERYKNRLRYIVARWGYSTSIAAWEFFNEIDNAVFSKEDSVLIPHDVVTDWHREMAAYLKSIDPYDHIVTTSVSHREIEGLYALEEIDLNQMHIYKRTHQIPGGIERFIKQYNKPFVWGEFAYEWDWEKDFEEIGPEMDFDYKRGLWYGLFSPTPILPMSWWWEFFDERGMTSYFRNVREINDRMLEAGNGSFERVDVRSQGVESYAVQCEDTYFVYLLNSGSTARRADIWIEVDIAQADFSLQLFDPATGRYTNYEDFGGDNGGVKVRNLNIADGGELIIVLRAE